MRYVIGSDEVGMGSWAGPVCVCAVAAPENWIPPRGLRDSKKVKSRKERERLSSQVRADHDLFWVVISESADEVDSYGIRSVVVAAHKTAITAVQRGVLDSGYTVADTIVDGNMHVDFARSVVRAEDEYPAVAAASVVAKVFRDAFMLGLALRHPGYGFGRHKGYGTEEHREALVKRGLIRGIHRYSFEPMKGMLN